MLDVKNKSFGDCLAHLTEQPVTHQIDGHDIRSLMFEDGKSPYEAFFYYDRQQLHAVRSGRWKLFVPLSSFTRHPHFKKGEGSQPILFDLVADTGCSTNVAAEHPAVVKRLLERAEEARTDLGDNGRQGTGQRGAGRITGSPVPLK